MTDFAEALVDEMGNLFLLIGIAIIFYTGTEPVLWISSVALAILVMKVIGLVVMSL